MEKLKILYIYDLKKWAIHNVGKIWADLLHQTHDFHIVQIGNHFQYNPKSYDIILWGYSLLALPHNSIVHTHRLKHWDLRHLKNVYAVVHDPCEIFDQIPNWKNTVPRLSHLKMFSKLAVISNEMKTILSENSFDVCKVNTMSHISLRSEKKIIKEQLKIFTRANPHQRKNLALFYDLADTVNGYVEKTEAFVGGKVLSQKNYINEIDNYNCYICTSWQEGGPLPLMDAMRRGCVILTTRVGQTDELIEDGINGFFCNSKEEYLERINQLYSDSGLLFNMRRNSFKKATEDKSGLIRQQLMSFLK